MDETDRQNGSVLIIVLWILMIIAFLSGEYLAHNRNKANLALNSMSELNRRAVVESFLQFYRSPGWNMVKSGHKAKDWIGLTLDSVHFFVRVDSEGSRININKAGDTIIRNKIKEICLNDSDTGAESYNRKADELADEITDAILDWRDADDLVRLHGAEKEYYVSHHKSFVPANGRFKKITELLMVKGVNRAVFVGKLLKNWQESDDSSIENYDIGMNKDKKNKDKGSTAGVSDKKASENKNSGDKTSEKKDRLSFLDAFTVYPGSARRISIRIPTKKNRVYSEVLIFDKNKKQLEHIYSFYYIRNGSFLTN